MLSLGQLKLRALLLVVGDASEGAGSTAASSRSAGYGSVSGFGSALLSTSAIPGKIRSLGASAGTQLLGTLAYAGHGSLA